MLASICDEGVYWVRKMCNPIWKLCELNNHLTILSGLRNPWRLDRLVKCSGWDPLSQFSAPVWAAQLYSFHWRIIDDDRRSMMIWKSCHICGEIDRLLIFISFFFSFQRFLSLNRFRWHLVCTQILPYVYLVVVQNDNHDVCDGDTISKT